MEVVKTEDKIHPVQANILRSMLFKTQARFADLNKSGLGNDHFSFHIGKLLELDLIEKRKDKKYVLTNRGKEFANRLDTETATIEKQAKVAVLIVGYRKSGKETQFLVQQRLKQPYFGFFGFITGKIKWGEPVEEASARELKEEANLEGKITLVGIKHKTDYSKEGLLLEDKYFFVCKAENTHGTFKESFEGGKNIWLPRKEIMKLPNLFDGVEESLKMVTQKSLTFSETGYRVASY